MDKISSFEQLNTRLLPYVNLVGELTGKDTVLDRIVPLMKFLGNPDKKLKAIHIAGTSGKTSTSYYIASLITNLGYKVGLTVSPHIDKISERAQINGETLPDIEFLEEINEFINLLEQTDIRPSYFELLYAFSIWLFAKHEVDYAVVETGLGGLFDATNILNREDKICVLTDIGYDHMNILGNTIEEITAQKVGIVHKNNQLIMYEQSEAIMNVVRPWTDSHDSKILIINEDYEGAKLTKLEGFDYLPEYQKRNFTLAYAVCDFLVSRDNLIKISTETIKTSLDTKIPARMDLAHIDNKLVIMDGAHNFQKMSAFVSSYKKLYKDQSATLILAFKTGKDYIKTLPLLIEIAETIILTNFSTSQDLPARSVDPNEVALELEKLGFNKYLISPDIKKVWNDALSISGNQPIIITGSFYLIAQFRGVLTVND